MAKSPEEYLKTFIGIGDKSIRNKYQGLVNLSEVGSAREKALADERLVLVKAAYSHIIFPQHKVEGKESLDSPVERKFEEDYPLEEQVALKYIQLARSARKRSKDFNLSFADIEELITTPLCYYTNSPLNKTHGDNFQRTIDRVDNNKGYVKGNVVACCHLANNIKNELFESPTSDIRANLNFMAKLITKIHKTTRGVI